MKMARNFESFTDKRKRPYQLILHEDETWDLINPDKVTRIYMDDQGAAMFMDDGSCIPLTRREVTEYLLRYMDWPEGMLEEMAELGMEF